MDKGGSREKRAVIVWHRRAGKDSAAMNFTAKEAMQRVGTYLHMFPVSTQGRKFLWDGVDGQGRQMIDQAFPFAIRRRFHTTSMHIELVNGSHWYVCGSDNYNALVGGNVVGVVFSEYSLTNPQAWNFIRPILRENGGWAIFPFTPRGPNHGKDLRDMAEKNPKWFLEELSVDDTGVFTAEDIQEERDSGMSDELIAQEYYVSFDSPNEGSYYGKKLAELKRQGGVGHFPWNPDKPVHTFWDIGVRDENGIWFIQKTPGGYNAIEYHETTDSGLPELAKVVLSKPYTYGTHWAGHDIANREWGAGQSRKKRARDLGLKFKTAEKLSLKEGIDAVKATIPVMTFHEEGCKQGLASLWHYHRTWDEVEKIWHKEPDHDWSEAGASSFRYFAVSKHKLARPVDNSDDSQSGDWMTS